MVLFGKIPHCSITSSNSLLGRRWGMLQMLRLYLEIYMWSGNSSESHLFRMQTIIGSIPRFPILEEIRGKPSVLCETMENRCTGGPSTKLADPQHKRTSPGPTLYAVNQSYSSMLASSASQVGHISHSILDGAFSPFCSIAEGCVAPMMSFPREGHSSMPYPVHVSSPAL